MIDSSSHFRGQFRLGDFFAVTAFFGVWAALGHYFGWVVLPLGLMFLGPGLFYFGRRWKVYGLEAIGVLVLLLSPLWILPILGILQQLIK